MDRRKKGYFRITQGEEELKKRSKPGKPAKRQYMSFLSAVSVFHLNKYLVLYDKCDGQTAHLTPNTVQYVHIIITSIITIIYNYI